MKLKIITLPFDKKLNGFDSELIEEFILNKEILNIEYKFFVKDKPYWTFVIQYETIVKEKSKKEIAQLQPKSLAKLKTIQ